MHSLLKTSLLLLFAGCNQATNQVGDVAIPTEPPVAAEEVELLQSLPPTNTPIPTQIQFVWPHPYTKATTESRLQKASEYHKRRSEITAMPAPFVDGADVVIEADESIAFFHPNGRATLNVEAGNVNFWLYGTRGKADFSIKFDSDLTRIAGHGDKSLMITHYEGEHERSGHDWSAVEKPDEVFDYAMSMRERWQNR